MRYLKKYEIDRICRRYHIEDYTINSDGTIDVNDGVCLWNGKLIELPLKFRSVSLSFLCSDNSLRSLIGCPSSVGGNFSCSCNNLTSLKGCPKLVSGNFWCNHNRIETFEGLDFIHIGRDFYCVSNPIREVWNLFWDHTKFEFFNDCDIIREDRVIILDRLNFFLDYINKPTVKEVRGYKCI